MDGDAPRKRGHVHISERTIMTFQKYEITFTKGHYSYTLSFFASSLADAKEKIDRAIHGDANHEPVVMEVGRA